MHVRRLYMYTSIPYIICDLYNSEEQNEAEAVEFGGDAMSMLCESTRWRNHGVVRRGAGVGAGAGGAVRAAGVVRADELPADKRVVNERLEACRRHSDDDDDGCRATVIILLTLPWFRGDPKRIPNSLSVARKRTIDDHTHPTMPSPPAVRATER